MLFFQSIILLSVSSLIFPNICNIILHYFKSIDILGVLMDMVAP
jgi:hypothetical protein